MMRLTLTAKATHVSYRNIFYFDIFDNGCFPFLAACSYFQRNCAIHIISIVLKEQWADALVMISENNNFQHKSAKVRVKTK